MASMIRAWINSPTGPKTTHFWGPVANWGFVLAGLNDTSKPEEQISGPMTGALTVYSGLFMRFAWRVQPRNFILLACHTCNASVQVRALSVNPVPLVAPPPGSRFLRDGRPSNASSAANKSLTARSEPLSPPQFYNLQRWYRWSSAQEQVNTGAAVIEPAKTK
jgi:hypothetical protein|tara:strand:- start:32 stop:520 length:489 start_codon:yes stop_codon:yes gene_type:complete